MIPDLGINLHDHPLCQIFRKLFFQLCTLLITQLQGNLVPSKGRSLIKSLIKNLVKNLADVFFLCHWVLKGLPVLLDPFLPRLSFPWLVFQEAP